MPDEGTAVAAEAADVEERDRPWPRHGRIWEVRLPRIELPEDPGRRLWPFVLVGLAVAFNLLALRDEVSSVLHVNDGSAHLSMIRWANERIRDGHLTLDGWYPYLGLGSSLFHHYPSLPHTVTGYVSLLVGTDRAFHAILYGLLSWWPVSVYLGARLLGWGRWPAASAALISPLIVSFPGYGFEHGSYTWRGLGLWPQLWSMWLLPIAWGLSWRAVSRNRSPGYGVAALVIALTIACHFITGFLAMIALAVWVAIKPSRWSDRLKRSAIVGGGALLIASWVWVPLFMDSRWANQSAYLRGTFWFDSFGAGQVFSWLGTGKLFDSARFPVLSLLALVGLVVCVGRWRRDESGRGLVVLLGVSLILFSGRSALGPILWLIPGSDDLFLPRFIQGVHLAGLLLAGVGTAWLGGLVWSRLERVVTGRRLVAAGVLVAAVGLAVLAPAWSERWAFDRQGGAWIQEQRDYDATEGAVVEELIDEAKARGPGRFYAGASGGWGTDYTVGFVPMYSVLLENDAEAIGFPFRTTYLSLSTDVEVLFDETRPAHYQLFNIRYLILPADRPPAVEATKISERFGHALWEVETRGYVDVVDTVAPVDADRTNVGAKAAVFLVSDQLGRGRYPPIAFDGAPAASSTLRPGERSKGPPGAERSESATLADGVVESTVNLRRPGMVMLRASFDPRWVVEVDGRGLGPQMVAPSYVGRTMIPGEHTVVFRYRPFPRYDLLFAIGILTFIGLQWGPRWFRMRLRRWEQAGDDAAPERPGGGPAEAEAEQAPEEGSAATDREPEDVATWHPGREDVGLEDGGQDAAPEGRDHEPQEPERVEPEPGGAPSARSPSSVLELIRVRTAARSGITFAVVLALLMGSLVLGFALRAPCVSYEWSDGRQYTRLCYTDIVPLLRTEQLTGDRRPYLDPCVQAPKSVYLGVRVGPECDEYPVLTMWTMRAAAWAAGDSFTRFFFANAALLWGSALVVAACLYALVGRRVLYFVLAPTLLIHATTNWDLIAVALATVGTVAYLRRRDVWSGVLLGLGAAAKLYPALLVLPFVAGRLRDRDLDGGLRLMGAAAGAWMVTNLPFALGAPEGWSRFFTFSSSRGADWDSLWFIGCEWATDLGCTDTRLVNVLSALLFVGSVALVWRLKSRREPGFPLWTLGFPVLVLFLLSGKVYSPQFSLWLLPWFALTLPNLRLFAAFQAADVGVFITRTSWFGTVAGLEGGATGLPLDAFELFAVARAFILILCVLAWLRRTSQEPIPTPVPASAVGVHRVGRTDVGDDVAVPAGV